MAATFQLWYRPMKHFFKVLISLIIILMVVAVVGVYWLSKTESGLNWALVQADEFVTFDRIEGELADFSFTGMRLNAQATSVTIASGQGQWQPWSLLTKTLLSSQLKLNDIEITLDPGAQQPQPYQPAPAPALSRASALLRQPQPHQPRAH